MVLNQQSQLSLDGEGGLYVVGDPKEPQSTQILYKPGFSALTSGQQFFYFRSEVFYFRSLPVGHTRRRGSIKHFCCKKSFDMSGKLRIKHSMSSSNHQLFENLRIKQNVLLVSFRAIEEDLRNPHHVLLVSFHACLSHKQSVLFYGPRALVKPL